MIRNVSTALAITIMLASVPVFAQSAGGGGSGDNSEVQICKTRFEQAQLRVKAMTDVSKQSMAMQQLNAAQAAMTGGNPTKCITELDKMGK
jgi:hypothetical protein